MRWKLPHTCLIILLGNSIWVLLGRSSRMCSVTIQANSSSSMPFNSFGPLPESQTTSICKKQIFQQLSNTTLFEAQGCGWNVCRLSYKRLMIPPWFEQFNATNERMFSSQKGLSYTKNSFCIWPNPITWMTSSLAVGKDGVNIEWTKRFRWPIGTVTCFMGLFEYNS